MLLNSCTHIFINTHCEPPLSAFSRSHVDVSVILITWHCYERGWHLIQPKTYTSNCHSECCLITPSNHHWVAQFHLGMPSNLNLTTKAFSSYQIITLPKETFNICTNISTILKVLQNLVPVNYGIFWFGQSNLLEKLSLSHIIC